MMTLDYQVLASGPTDALVVLIGECPASEELNQGKVFVGSTGKYLTALLEGAELYRDSLYITNVSKEQAPKNKMANMSFDRLKAWEQDLLEEINLLPNPKVLVPMGNYALKAVTGRTNITNLRGSVLPPVDKILHDCIVIPTIHPSAIHYNYSVWPLIFFDFVKIKRISESGIPFQFPAYKFILQPTFEETMSTLGMLEKKKDTLMTIDVETPHMLLSCIGIAWSKTEAFCLPFFWGNGKNYWSEEEEFAIWRRLSEVLPKLNLANQNVLFDWEIMANYGISLKIPKFDPMLMHACLYSELRHKLEIITSIYTDMEFYKRDEKEEKGSALKAGDEMNHWRYNVLDTIAALWSIEELAKELIEENMMEFYLNFFADLIEPIFLMNMRGIRLNRKDLEKSRKELTIAAEEIDAEITRAAGYEVNVKSPKQVAIMLYDNFGMQPPKIRGDEKGRSTSEEAMKKLAHKYQIDLPLRIVEARKHRKLMSLFSEENISDGDRVKCQYSLARTTTGRLASKKKKGGLGGKGMNLQNVKSSGPARSFFVAEEGHVIVGADQKGADARVVAWLSKDKKFISLFESGQSVHIQNAKNVFGKDITKEDPLYRIAKAMIHGCVLGDHEVLTRKGWIPFQEFELLSDEIAQWDSGKISFVQPKFVKYEYSGRMFSFEGTSLDLDATPDHRMPYINGSGNLGCSTVLVMPRSVRIPTTGIYEGSEVGFPLDYSLLAVAVQADGSIYARKVIFHLLKERKIIRLRHILKKLRIHFRDIPCGCHDKGRRISFSLDDTVLSLFLNLDYNENYVATKTFKYELLNLPLKMRQAIIEELPFWDGYSSNDIRNRKSYVTTNLLNAEFIQTLAHVSGIQALLRYEDRIDKRRLYTVSFNNRQLARISSCKEISHQYDGLVYCVTVPSSFFLIRRNHKIFVSGNSNYGIGPWQFAYSTGLPFTEAKQKLELYYYTYPGIKGVFHAYVREQIRKCRMLFNPFGRRQVFFGRLNDTTFRAGYAFIPQSTVSDINKTALKKVYKSYLPLIEAHDGLYISVPANDVQGGVEALKDAYDIEFEIWGEKHSIPIELSMGDNWRDMEEIS